MSHSTLTKCCDELDRAILQLSADKEKIANEGENIKKFLEDYQEIALKKMNDTWQSSIIKALDRSTPSEVKLDMMRRELKMLQQCYNKSVQEISELYTKCSGDFDRIRSHLKGETAVLWIDSEDDVLRKGKDFPEYRTLVLKKGEAEIQKRKKFLESANSS